jgi:hypothetical protein
MSIAVITITITKHDKHQVISAVMKTTSSNIAHMSAAMTSTISLQVISASRATITSASIAHMSAEAYCNEDHQHRAHHGCDEHHHHQLWQVLGGEDDHHHQR